jgi:hypothetical protein
VIEAIVLSDVERGARLYLYAGLACFTYFYWLVQYRTKATAWNLFFLGLAASASVLSLSRVYLLLLFCLTVLFICQPKPATVTITARLLFFAGSAFVLSGMVYTSLNPFEFFAGDSSGSYRAMEYDVVRNRIQMDPLSGFGLSPVMELSKPFLGPFQIYASDLGSLGVWFDFGAIGLILYFLVLWVCSRPSRSLPFEHGWPLFLTGALMTADGCISPMATADGGATITGLILAAGLTAKASQLRERAPRRPVYPVIDNVAT